MNMENSTAEKNGQEAAQQGAAAANPTSPVSSTDKSRTAQAAAVGAHTPLGLLLGGAAVVLALMTERPLPLFPLRALSAHKIPPITRRMWVLNSFARGQGRSV